MKHPPRNIDAERSLLGSLMRGATVTLPVEAFYLDAHRRIYTAIRELAVVDLAAVATRLWRKQEVQDIGGYGYLASVFDAGYAPVTASWWACQIEDCWRRRKLIAACELIINTAHRPHGPAEEVCGDALELIRAA